MSKIKASCNLNGRKQTDIEVLNPGEWFGETYLVEIGCGYSSFYRMVEAGSVQDALDIFADSEKSHHIDIAPEDMGDYDEDEVCRLGNDSHPVNLDNVWVYGGEPDHRGSRISDVRYHGDGLPEQGIEPGKLSDWPLSGNGDTFEVIEYSSYYSVRHKPSGQERVMSDGVDVLFDDDDEPISPGSEGFVQLWTDALNADESETLAAYFPEFKAID